MDFFDITKTRRAVRAFEAKEIRDAKLQQILETILSAPSAGNLQAYKIFVVKDLEKKKALARAALEQKFIAESSLALVFCANPERSAHKYGARGRKLYALQDATIAAAYAQLAATGLGLATCWVGAFSEEAVLEVIGNPKGLVPTAIIPIGFPAEKPLPTPRRNLKDIVHHT